MDKKEESYIIYHPDGTFTEYSTVDDYYEHQWAEREYVLDHQFVPEPPKCTIDDIAAANCDVATFINEILEEEDGKSKE